MPDMSYPPQTTGGSVGSSGPGSGSGQPWAGAGGIYSEREELLKQIKAAAAQQATQVPPPAVHPAVATHLSLMAELKALLIKIETNLFHLHVATKPDAGS